MGVPYFFKKLLDKERKYKQQILFNKLNKQPNILYIDGNCAIHPECFKIAEQLIDEPDTYIKEGFMINKIIEFFDYLEEYVNPKKEIYIAIDGVAPMAKINQQRKRRVKSVIDNEIKNDLKKKFNKKISNWSNSVISPGTEFMERLHLALIKHYKNKSKITKKIYTYSSYHTRGEGEHKILQDIKNKNNKNSVVYGLDADLIFLTLASNVSELYLLRESSTFNNDKTEKKEKPELTYVSVDSIKKIINYEMLENISSETEDFDKKKYENINFVNDYIFICFIIGNDFLPHPPSIDLRKEGLEMITRSYCRAFCEFNENIIQKNDKIIINEKIFIRFLKILGNLEFDYFTQIYPNYIRKNMNKKCFSKDHYDIELWKIENLRNINIVDNVKLGDGNINEWKIRYYDNYFDINEEDEINSIIKCYLEGINWVTKYYFDTCEDWKWFYPYDHIPFLSDIHKFLKNNDKLINNFKNKKRKNIEILTQLLIIMPVQYSYNLPSSYKKLVTLSNSNIIDIFPIEVELDYLYKDMFWQCDPKLPIINIERILNETKELKISINSNKRNQELDNFIF